MEPSVFAEGAPHASLPFPIKSKNSSDLPESIKLESASHLPQNNDQDSAIETLRAARNFKAIHTSGDYTTSVLRDSSISSATNDKQ